MECRAGGVIVTEGDAFWTVYVPIEGDHGLLIHLPRAGSQVIQARCDKTGLLSQTIIDGSMYWNELVEPYRKLMEAHRSIWGKLSSWRHAETPPETRPL